MELTFCHRARIVAGMRSLVEGICDEYLVGSLATDNLIMAVQELLENVVKYSCGRGEVSFELLLVNGQPYARISTVSQGIPQHQERACQLLEQIASTPDPAALYQAMVAGSGDGEGSGLGLIRIRAESGLVLRYAVVDDQLSIEAMGPVHARPCAPNRAHETVCAKRSVQ